MKCPKCNYVSHDYLEDCRKCKTNFAVFKQQIGLFVLPPGILDLSVVLGSRADDDIFSTRLEETDGRTGVDDFDISLDDYADRPMMRRVSGTFIRPGMQEDGRNLQHLTLQLDAPSMSTELPQSIIRPAVDSPRAPERPAPPPLPPGTPPEGNAGSSSGHLTLELDSSNLDFNIPSGQFPQPPGVGNALPMQPLRTERVARPDQETAEDEVSDSITLDMDTPSSSHIIAGPLIASGLLSGNVPAQTEDSADLVLPLLDSTSDDPGRLPPGSAPAVQATGARPGPGEPGESDALSLPTVAFVSSRAMTIDVDTNVMKSTGRQTLPQHRDSSSDNLHPGVPDQGGTAEALTFDMAEPLHAESTMPGPEEILPSGVLPRAGLEAASRAQALPDANASFELGDTLSELAAADFGEEDLEFEFQGLADGTGDDPGLVDDANPFQFDLDDIPTAAAGKDNDQAKQHESMPGHLTLELDAGAMSIELSSTTAEEASARSNMSETERRSVEFRLAPETVTETPLADVVFTSLEDTFELDDVPQASESGHVTLELDANTIGDQLPAATPGPAALDSAPPGSSAASAPQAKSSPGDEEEFLLDLDDLDDAPRKS